MSNQSVSKYIEDNWEKCIREKKENSDTLIGLPLPYTVPAIGHFEEMYYWDTYFTNLGLLFSGRTVQARNNVDNMLYLVDKYGFMPNGNRTFYLSRSQPPFLSEMVKDIYNSFNDKKWLKNAFSILEKEYSFWMNERISEIGLNVYGGKLDKKDIVAYAEDYIKRVGYSPELSVEELANQNIASCESGWDCNPRFAFCAKCFAPVDLNSLMYGFEKNMQFFASELELDGNVWGDLALNRMHLMEKYLINQSGVFLDYNFEKDEFSDVFSAASYYPMFTKLATHEKAVILVEQLHRIEGNHGIFTCEKNDCCGNYQWDYPNGWPCLQFIVVSGLENYGFREHAIRIAHKYISTVESVFMKTGALWEKYNVDDGSINVKNEYDMPAMMGWSAGVYLALKNYLFLHEKEI